MKLSRREKNIRIAGILFVLSPFFNFLIPVLMTKNPQVYLFNLHGLAFVLKSSSMASRILDGASLVMGFMMIRGRSRSWALVLTLLAGFIMYGAYNFRADTHDGVGLPLLFLFINLGAFALVYTQEFHQQVHGFGPPVPAPTPGPAPAPTSSANAVFRIPKIESIAAGPMPVLSLRLPLIVDFPNFGHWADITGMSEQEIRIKARTNAYPVGLDTAVCEFLLPNGTTPLAVQARLTSRANGELVFRILNGEFQQAA